MPLTQELMLESHEARGIFDLPHDPDALERVFNELLAHVPELPLDTSHASSTLYDILKADSEAAPFFDMAIQHGRLLSMLQDTSSEYTVFLPLDMAVPGDQQAGKRSEDLPALHISPHYVKTDDFLYMPNVPTILIPANGNGPQILRTRGTASGWYINGTAHVVQANVQTSNGLIHKLDRALPPPPTSFALLERHGGLDTFRRAIEICGLQQAFAAPDIKGRTVFAPHDSAWEALGPETLRFLLDTEAGRPYLGALLKRHFCPNITFFSNFIWPKNNTGARRSSADPQRKIKGRMAQQVPTMLAAPGEKEAESLSVAVARCNGLISMMVDGLVRVVEQDLAASDGVVHVLDSVLTGDDAGKGDAGVSPEAVKSRFAAYIR